MDGRLASTSVGDPYPSEVEVGRGWSAAWSEKVVGDGSSEMMVVTGSSEWPASVDFVSRERR